MSNNVQDTTYDIVCPFCFRRYTNFKALFADFRSCTDEIYPEYAEYMRYFLGLEAFGGRKMPVLFKKEGNDGLDSYFAAVTASGDVTYARACPFCCNLLPAQAGRVKPFSVVVTGSDDAERSFFIASALHRLNADMGKLMGASFLPADYSTASSFYEQYEEPLYARHIVPEAIATVSPLNYEYRKKGADTAEEWIGSTACYHRALVSFYNIDRDLCDRYPTVALTAISQASGIVFVSDAAGAAANDDPTYDPWLGYLTETFGKVFGPTAADKPAAIVLTKSDAAALSDRKWSPLVRQAASLGAKKKLPSSQIGKLSGKAASILRARLPAYMSAVDSLFEEETRMFFPVKTFFEQHENGTADIKDTDAAELPLRWLLAKLGMFAESGTGRLVKKR